MMSYTLAPLVFVASALVDVCHAHYVRALVAGARHRAARWAVGQWLSATVGFAVAVRVSLWYLPLEAAGLYVGSLIGVTLPKPIDKRVKSPS
jgi:hypothetical protein